MKPFGRFAVPVFAALSIVAGTALLPSCARSAPPLRIAVDGSAPSAVWAVAKSEGFLEGGAIEIVRYSTVDDGQILMDEGRIDLIHASFPTASFDSGKTRPENIVLSFGANAGSLGLAVSKRCDSAKGLVGARIAVEGDTEEQFLLKEALEALGLGLDSVRLVTVPADLAMELFIAGQVDACFTLDPWLSGAAASGKGRVVWATNSRHENASGILAASSGALSSRRIEIERLVDAWFLSLDFIRRNPSKAYPIMAASLGMGMRDFAPSFEAFRFRDRQNCRDVLAASVGKAEVSVADLR
ncbi:MAG: ABC transporter substrate-binding protein [Spirochaetota bacterium]